MASVNYYPTNGLNSWTGYGKLEVGLARGLRQAGIDLRLDGEAEVSIIVGYPQWCEAPHVANTRKWLLTQCESTRVSQKWVEAINKQCDRLLVTNPMLPVIFRDSGVHVPISYVGHGCDLFTPPLRERICEPFTDGFNFLTYTYGDMRKGAELAIMAFKKLFGGRKGFRLLIKARDGHANTWIAGLQDEQMQVIGGQQSEAEWQDLLRRSHCFIFPSRGEGFGLPPREATLMGVPTMATQWLGLWDVDKWGLTIDVVDLTPAHFDKWEANAEGALWAQPDSFDIERHMEWIVDRYDEAQDIAVAGREYLLTNSSYTAMGQRVAELLENYG